MLQDQLLDWRVWEGLPALNQLLALAQVWVQAQVLVQEQVLALVQEQAMGPVLVPAAALAPPRVRALEYLAMRHRYCLTQAHCQSTRSKTEQWQQFEGDTSQEVIN